MWNQVLNWAVARRQFTEEKQHVLLPAVWLWVVLVWKDQVTVLQTIRQLNTNTSLLVMGSQVRFTSPQGGVTTGGQLVNKTRGERWRDKSLSFLGELIKSLVDCRSEGSRWTVEGRGEESGFPSCTCCTSHLLLLTSREAWSLQTLSKPPHRPTL